MRGFYTCGWVISSNRYKGLGAYPHFLRNGDKKILSCPAGELLGKERWERSEWRQDTVIYFCFLSNWPMIHVQWMPFWQKWRLIEWTRHLFPSCCATFEITMVHILHIWRVWCLRTLSLKEEWNSQKWLFIHSIKMYEIFSNIPGYVVTCLIHYQLFMWGNV